MNTAQARTSQHGHKALRTILTMTAATLAAACIARIASHNRPTKPPVSRPPPEEPPDSSERKGRITIVTKPHRSRA